MSAPNILVILQAACAMCVGYAQSGGIIAPPGADLQLCQFLQHLI
ncbi:Uncharacterised protein [Yersinia enterocolitica]|nr:hypothetical protein DJ61_1415 [Yersinia enterocolitica]CNG17644.1 Uncharacterised protein [Yersinia enterocolitica]